MEAALKMGLMKEMTFKSTPKLHFDECWSSNPQNAASPSSDYIFVDQLLNFSNEEEQEQEQEAEGVEKNNHSSVSAPLQLQQHHDSDLNSNHSSTNSSEDDFWSTSSRDFEDLEWLSHLVADSTQEEFSAAPPPCSVFLTEKTINYQKETTQHLHPLANFEFNLNTPFPSKPRSKRAKISGRVWSLPNSISSPPLCSPPAKKPKKNPAEEGSGRVQAPRRCSHCGVQKTPQWRAGPLGAKSLCNACGVRFKSGRLFPEYRPACSPTFSSEIHSNHHRKVLEMRRKKETEKPYSGPDPIP